MIDRDHDLPITRQAELLAISRGSVYYLARRVSEADLALMRRIDECPASTILSARIDSAVLLLALTPCLT